MQDSRNFDRFVTISIVNKFQNIWLRQIKVKEQKQ